MGQAFRLTGVILLLLAAMPAEAANDKRFGNVTVTCAEEGSCVAVIYADGTSKAEPGTVLHVGRPAGARSSWSIGISTLGRLADRDRPVSLSIDNGVSTTLRPDSDYTPLVQPSDFYIVSQTALDRMMSGLQTGHVLRFSWLDISAEPHTDSFVLDGFSAALTEIDKRQGRIAGDRRATAPDLPPAPEINVEVAIAADGIPPRLMELHMADGECEAADSPSLSSVKPIISQLTDPSMLYAIPCYKTGDRTNYRIYVYEMGEIGGMHRITFATYSRRFGWMGTDVLEQVAFDTATNLLSATDLDDKGCGSRGQWVWDDYAFRQKSFDITEPCAAKPVWVTIYPEGKAP